MLMDLKQSVTERYASLLAQMPAEQAQSWVETRSCELGRQIELLQRHTERTLQRRWKTSHDGQAPDPTSSETLHSQAAQIAQDTILSALWEEIEPAEEYDPSQTRQWPNVQYFPNDAISELIEHLWPQYLDNSHFTALAHTLINARMWDKLPVPSEPTDVLTRELEIRVLDALAREAAANQPHQS